MIQYILIRVYVLQRLKVLGNSTCSPLVTAVWQSSALVWYQKNGDAFHHHLPYASSEGHKVTSPDLFGKNRYQMYNFSQQLLFTTSLLAWSDMVWEWIYSVFLHTTDTDLGIFDPIFAWQQKYPFMCKLYCKVFRISGWKITQFSVFCLFCCEWQKMSLYHGYSHRQLLSPKCCNRIWDLRSPKLSLKNSQFCIVNKKPWASAGESNRFASGWKFSSCKISPRTNSVGMNKRLKDTNFAMQVNNLSLAFHQHYCC